MMNADENMPIAGTSQHNGKTENPGKKAEKRRRKTRQQPDLKSEAKSEIKSDAVKSDALLDTPEPLRDVPDQVDQAISSNEASAAFHVPGEDVPSEPRAPAEPAAVNVQVITDAYGSYTKKSLEQTTSFFEQLAGTRSLNRAFELQTEFARTAFDTFVAESRKIRELHRELAKQRLNSLEGFVMGRSATHST